MMPARARLASVLLDRLHKHGLTVRMRVRRQQSVEVWWRIRTHPTVTNRDAFDPRNEPHESAHIARAYAREGTPVIGSRLTFARRHCRTAIG